VAAGEMKAFGVAAMSWHQRQSRNINGSGVEIVISASAYHLAWRLSSMAYQWRIGMAYRYAMAWHQPGGVALWRWRRKYQRNGERKKKKRQKKRKEENKESES
jgi:hypothetical protein